MTTADDEAVAARAPAPGLPTRSVRGWVGKVASLLAIGTALFHLYTGLFGPPEPFLFRIVHLTLMISLALLFYPARRGQFGAGPSLYDFGLLAAWLAAMGYLLVEYDAVINRLYYVTPLTWTQRVLAVTALLLVLEVSRRTVGSALTLVAVVILFYPFVGPYLPGVFFHTGKSLDYILDNQYLLPEGIFGIVTGISATYIILFVVFGAFLNRSGFGAFIIDIATALAGWSRGGPAKIAVIASGLVGMVQGYSTANVVTTGVFTIPMMKRVGLRPEFAAGVEAAASTGGNVMPPVMAAAAFIMAEFTGIPYVTIIKYAFIPASLYFLSIGFMVHLYAVEHRIPTIPRSELASVRAILRERGHLSIPLFLLVGLLIRGQSPMLAACAAILGVVVVSQFRKNTRMGLRAILQALEEGAKSSIIVAAACAVSGIIIAVIVVTGLGQRFSSEMVTLAGGNPYLLLTLAAVASLVIGMGIPLVPAYIIQLGVVIPALVDAGIPVAQAHLFVIFFCSISLITPPMAITSYAAAAIAGADMTRTCWEAIKLAASSYIIPFMFAFAPALLLIGTPVEVMLAVVTSVVGVFALSVAIQGYLVRRLDILTRIAFFGSAVALIEPGVLTDGAGIGLFLILCAYLRRTQARASARPPDTAEEPTVPMANPVDPPPPRKG